MVHTVEPHYLPTGSNQPTELMQDDESWQSGIVEGPDMVETSTQLETLHALLFGQRRGRLHLCHRLGQLPLGSSRSLH